MYVTEIIGRKPIFHKFWKVPVFEFRWGKTPFKIGFRSILKADLKGLGICFRGSVIHLHDLNQLLHRVLQAAPQNRGSHNFQMAVITWRSEISWIRKCVCFAYASGASFGIIGIFVSFVVSGNTQCTHFSLNWPIAAVRLLL